MPKVERGGPKTAVGMVFLEIEEIGASSFCPDSNDASTPATQVHMTLRVKGVADYLGIPKTIRPPTMVARFLGTGTLDAFIEALIEHRTYVFGRRQWDATGYPEQQRG
jgi:hypothetical protein